VNSPKAPGRLPKASQKPQPILRKSQKNAHSGRMWSKLSFNKEACQGKE
jgi:hypothetical protein